MRNIFITGATGFLGSYLLKCFLDDDEVAPIVLARGKKGESAAERIKKTLKYFYGEEKYKAVLKRLKIIEGEIDNKTLGMDTRTRQSLANEIDEIYHSAAITEFIFPLDKIRKINVDGTENILKFALECRDKGRLTKVNHVSTAYVKGAKKGIFFENELTVGQEFNNSYEQSKFEAEKLVQKYREQGLAITIFRPSTITGDYATGKTSNFKMLYQPLHFFNAELFEIVPGNGFTLANLIPVDFAAKEICLIGKEKESNNRTFHIVSSSSVQIEHFFDLASDFFGFKKIKFIPLRHFNMTTLTDIQRILINPFIPYFEQDHLFDLSNTKKVLDRKSFKGPIIDNSFLLKLFKFCITSGFIKPKRQYVTAG